MCHRFAGAVIEIVALGSMIQPALSEEPLKIGVMFPFTGPDLRARRSRARRHQAGLRRGK